MARNVTPNLTADSRRFHARPLRRGAENRPKPSAVRYRVDGVPKKYTLEKP
jgi:hypothetical protein